MRYSDYKLTSKGKRLLRKYKKADLKEEMVLPGEAARQDIRSLDLIDCQNTRSLGKGRR